MVFIGFFDNYLNDAPLEVEAPPQLGSLRARTSALHAANAALDAALAERPNAVMGAVRGDAVFRLLADTQRAALALGGELRASADVAGLIAADARSEAAAALYGTLRARAALADAVAAGRQTVRATPLPPGVYDGRELSLSLFDAQLREHKGDLDAVMRLAADL